MKDYLSNKDLWTGAALGAVGYWLLYGKKECNCPGTVVARNETGFIDFQEPIVNPVNRPLNTTPEIQWLRGPEWDHDVYGWSYGKAGGHQGDPRKPYWIRPSGRGRRGKAIRRADYRPGWTLSDAFWTEDGTSIAMGNGSSFII
jgi:hypothetical protein